MEARSVGRMTPNSPGPTDRVTALRPLLVAVHSGRNISAITRILGVEPASTLTSMRDPLRVISRRSRRRSRANGVRSLQRKRSLLQPGYSCRRGNSRGCAATTNAPGPASTFSYSKIGRPSLLRTEPRSCRPGASTSPGFASTYRIPSKSSSSSDATKGRGNRMRP